MAAAALNRSLASRRASDCARKLKVLADPTRLGVLEALLDGPRVVGELVSVLRVEQSLLSHHLRVLREAGLVEAQREGKSVRYRIPAEADVRGSGQVIHLGCCDLSFEAPGTARSAVTPSAAPPRPPGSQRPR